MAWKISSLDICIIIMSLLIMNGPIFGIINGPDFRSALCLIFALAGLKVGGEGVH